MKPSDETTPLAQLLDEIATFIRRFMVMSEPQLNTIVLWTAHTHVAMAFDFTAYIFVTSAAMGSGKSTLIDVLDLLVRLAERPIDPTAASLFWLIEGVRPTLLVDEADLLAESKPLRQVWNSGFQSGGYVTRVEANGSGERIVHKYATFCPKLLAGIALGKPPLHPTVVDRSVVIRLQRPLPTETVEKFRRRQDRSPKIATTARRS